MSLNVFNITGPLAGPRVTTTSMNPSVVAQPGQAESFQVHCIHDSAMKHSDIWYLNNIKQHLKNLVLSCVSWRSEHSEELLNWKCVKMFGQISCDQAILRVSSVPVVPHIVKVGTGETFCTSKLTIDSVAKPCCEEWKDILFSASRQKQLRCCSHFCGEHFLLLEDFGFISLRHSHCQQHQCLLTQKWTFWWMDSLWLRWDVSFFSPKDSSQLRPVLQNMQSVSSAHSATNSPRFFVGVETWRRIVECFTSLFLGKFCEGSSVNSWLNHIVFRAAYIAPVKAALLLSIAASHQRDLWLELLAWRERQCQAQLTQMPGKGAEILRSFGRMKLRSIEMSWKSWLAEKKIKNKLTSQQKLENCLQFWDNLSIIAKDVIRFLLCFMFSLGK